MLNPIWNADEKRPRAGIRILVQFFLRGALLVAGTHALAAVAVSDGELDPERSWIEVLKRWSPDQPAYAIVIACLEPAAAVLSALVCARFLDRRPFARLGFHVDRRWWLDLAFGLALGCVLVAAVFGIEVSMGWLEVTGSFVNESPAIPLAGLVCISALACFGNGVEEELADRGYPMRNGAEGLRTPRVGPKVALAIVWTLTSMFFGLQHFSTWDVVAATALIGAVFALSFVLTGELAIAIGLHTTWNFMQITVLGMASTRERTCSLLATRQTGHELWTGGDHGEGLLGVIAIVVAALAIVAWVRRTRGAVALRTELADHRAG